MRVTRRSREAGRKPSSVPDFSGDDHSSGTRVAPGLKQPTRELWAGQPQALPYLALLRVGFSKPAMSPLPLVSSYLTFSPLPWTYHGGLVSVALSLGLPPLGITQHPALWSSDFPPAACQQPAIIWPTSRPFGHFGKVGQANLPINILPQKCFAFKQYRFTREYPQERHSPLSPTLPLQVGEENNLKYP